MFKTQPFKHQKEGLRRLKNKPAYAILWEQGTGKSKTALDDAARLYREHKIDLLLIIAPKGVVPVWVKQQIPTHLPDDIPRTVALWKSSSHTTNSGRRQLQAVLDAQDTLRIICMNTEAFGATKQAVDFAIETLDSASSAMIVLDESHRAKSPQAHTTKRILNLRNRSTYRRIMTGTVGDSPFDLWSQFYFLDPDIIGIDSFTAFKCEYAELLPASHGLMRHITRRVPKVWSGKYINDDTGGIEDAPYNADGSPRAREMVPKYLPTIVATNADGSPRYRNLDKLQELIAPYSYRILKKDCLDLPNKLYSRYYAELTDQQWVLYEQVRDQQRIELEERVVTFNKLTALLRLQQIVCGYIVVDERIQPLFATWSDNPRIVAMLEYLADRRPDESTIIWCRFVEDIKQVTAALTESYGAQSVVQFYGATSDNDRVEAVARFQGERPILDRRGNLLRTEPVANRARFIVSQQQSGGVGQTWTAATLSFHYSNSFSLIDRLQAEDRPHRIGQEHPVQYLDLEAEDTVDTTIINALIAKKEVADVINNDESLEWLAYTPRKDRRKISASSRKG